jgi:poly-gamma-glutamate capsule biosynthesis protein CapA/YwtB (metallophosphatase superfamily)
MKYLKRELAHRYECSEMNSMLLALLLSQVAPSPNGTIRIRAVGDVMLGSAFPEGHLPPDNGSHLLDAVAPLLKDADLTFANLEGPFCDLEAPSTKCKKNSGNSCFAFRTPTVWAQYLKDVGVDVGSTANNHAGDFGEACRRQTEKKLDELGILWSGPKDSVAYLTVNGKKIGLIAFYNSAATNDLNDFPSAKKIVSETKAKADIVILSFHGGAEGAKKNHVPKGTEMFMGENRGNLRKFTHLVIDAGADLVIGHGPHVLRGMEIYKNKLIAYSLGNFATYGRFSLGGPLAIAGVLEVTIDSKGDFEGGKFLSTKQIGKGVPQPDENEKGFQLLKELSESDFEATAPKFGSNGVISK